MPCATCRSGCSCLPTDPGCGHYGCWGRGPRDCAGADAEQRRYETLLAQQRRDQRAHRARRAHLALSYQTISCTYRLPGLA